MAISFTRFKDLIATGQFEPARSNLFSVQMGIPIFMRDKLGEFGGPQGFYEAIDYLCSEATVPSRNLMTGEVTNFGSMRRYATGQTPQEITLSFIVTKNQWHRGFFEHWINSISRDTENRSLFYDNYVTDLVINKWESGSNHVTRYVDANGNPSQIRNNKITAQWRAVGVFPYNISQMQFTNDQTQLMKIDVQFYCERFRMGRLVKTQGDWTNDIVKDAGFAFEQTGSVASSAFSGTDTPGRSGIPALDRTINAIGEVTRAVDSVSSAINSIGSLFR